MSSGKAPQSTRAPVASVFGMMPSMGNAVRTLTLAGHTSRRLPTSGRSLPRNTRQAIAAAAVAAAFVALFKPAFADPLSVSAFGQLALRCGPSVAPSTLAAIAKTESGFEPLSVNDNTTGISGVPATPERAIQLASRLLEAGHSVDIGVMQINSANFARLGLTLASAFDPCRSIAAGAAILAGDYTGGNSHAGQQSALRVAISRYNTGDSQRGFINGYVSKVELAAAHIVPAIDVGAAPAAIDSKPIPTTAVSTPVDPNAPPSWDVWLFYDYTVAHAESPVTPAPSDPGSGAAVLATAGVVPVPLIER